jgi:hypothetical protein
MHIFRTTEKEAYKKLDILNNRLHNFMWLLELELKKHDIKISHDVSHGFCLQKSIGSLLPPLWMFVLHVFSFGIFDFTKLEKNTYQIQDVHPVIDIMCIKDDMRYNLKEASFSIAHEEDTTKLVDFYASLIVRKFRI